MRNKEEPPLPGSAEAVALLCSCPIFDNAHGQGLEFAGTKVFWVNENCPLHGMKLKTGDNENVR